jgi:hypothetical protein
MSEIPGTREFKVKHPEKDLTPENGGEMDLSRVDAMHGEKMQVKARQMRARKQQKAEEGEDSQNQEPSKEDSEPGVYADRQMKAAPETRVINRRK